MEAGQLDLQVFPAGFAWLDSGTYESLLEASNYVARVEREEGRVICCPEEAAFRAGFLPAEKLREYGEADKNNGYGQYMTRLYNEEAK
jgi:glucose-1-phosphate thymidylyltransferase